MKNLKTDWLGISICVNENNLEKFNNFNNGYSAAWENRLNNNGEAAVAWLNSKQDVLKTNAEVIETSLTNYHDGYKQGFKNGLFIVAGMLFVVIIPITVNCALKIVEHYEQIKTEKTKQSMYSKILDEN